MNEINLLKPFPKQTHKLFDTFDNVIYMLDLLNDHINGDGINYTELIEIQNSVDKSKKQLEKFLERVVTKFE